MGRAPCCEKIGLKRGRWTAEEDEILTKYIQANGEGSWRSLPKKAGLLRCGKSCRLRWINYLRSDLKRGNITHQEEETIIKLHNLFGNKWSLIATHLPGRTDNEIKNYWNSHLSRKIYAFANMADPNLIVDSRLVSEISGSGSGSGSSSSSSSSLSRYGGKKKKNKGRTSRSAMKKHKQMVAAAAAAAAKTEASVKQPRVGATEISVSGPQIGEDQADPDDKTGQKSEIGEKGQNSNLEGEKLGPYEWLDNEIERLMGSCIWENEELMRVNDDHDHQDKIGEENGDHNISCFGFFEEQESGTKFADMTATKVDGNVEREREGSFMSSNSDEGGSKDWWVNLCSSESSFGFDGDWLDWDFLDGFMCQSDLLDLEILG